MGFQKKTAVAPVATVATPVDSILGQGASLFSKAIASINDAVSKLDGLEEKAANLTLIIADRESRVEALEADFNLASDALNKSYEEKEREYKVNFDLKVKANEKGFVDNWLSTNGLVTTTQVYLDSLQEQYDNLKSNYADDVHKEVGKALGIAESKHKSELTIKDKEFAAKEADNNAKLAVAAEKISFLEGQVNYWKEQLNEERKAGIERAKAAQATFQLPSQNNR